MKVRVRVHQRDYEVTVYQEKPTVWTATGTYMNEWHQTKGTSENYAVSRWREWARYKGNDPGPSDTD